MSTFRRSVLLQWVASKNDQSNGAIFWFYRKFTPHVSELYIIEYSWFNYIDERVLQQRLVEKINKQQRLLLTDEQFIDSAANQTSSLHNCEYCKEGESLYKEISAYIAEPYNHVENFQRYTIQTEHQSN